MLRRTSISVLVLTFLLAAPAQAFHKAGHAPPGQALPVCDCLAVEVRQSVYEDRDILVAEARDLVGALTVSGFIHCTEPDPEFETSGESTLRLVLYMLGAAHPLDQEFCRP